MSDPFATLIADARAFLTELAANNNRDWFTEQKPRYEVELKAPASLLLDQIAQDVGKALGQSLSTKLFRPHRDVRFSKDKTPYHTHLHMLWAVQTDTRQSPMLFFGIAPDYVSAGGGVMGFDKPVLTDWRAAVDGDFGDALQSTLDDLAKLGFKLRDPDLKRVPSPYAQDHRHSDLLRRKGLSVWRELPATDHANPVAALTDTFAALKRLLEKLSELG